MMKIKSELLKQFTLDAQHSLLDTRSVYVLKQWFDVLDVHQKGALNDVQFVAFVRHITDLSSSQASTLFDMLDVDASGEIEFHEFYLLMALFIAIKDGTEKQFVHRHARQIFEVIDYDGSGSISAEEFKAFGFLFNYRSKAAKKLFNEFDISGDQLLDFEEFDLFTVALMEEESSRRDRDGVFGSWNISSIFGRMRRPHIAPGLWASFTRWGSRPINVRGSYHVSETSGASAAEKTESSMSAPAATHRISSFVRSCKNKIYPQQPDRSQYPQQPEEIALEASEMAEKDDSQMAAVSSPSVLDKAP